MRSFRSRENSNKRRRRRSKFSALWRRYKGLNKMDWYEIFSPRGGVSVDAGLVNFRWSLLTIPARLAEQKKLFSDGLLINANLPATDFFIESKLYLKKESESSFSMVGTVINDDKLSIAVPIAGSYVWYVSIDLIASSSSGRRKVYFWVSLPQAFKVAAVVKPSAVNNPNIIPVVSPDVPLNDAVVITDVASLKGDFRNPTTPTTPTTPSTTSPVKSALSPVQVVLVLGVLASGVYVAARGKVGIDV
jgi:hypothetical protein